MSEPLQVLIVDDDPQFRLRLEVALEADGIAVVGSTADGDAAVTLAAARSAAIVLMDLDLRSGAVRATSAIHRAVPGSRVVILAVSDSAPDLFEAIKAGAAAYLLKSRPLGELIVALRPVRDGMRFINPKLASQIMGVFASMAPRADDPGPLPRLTDRERTVLELIAGKHPIPEIGRRLSISSNAVKHHLRNAVDKLHFYGQTAIP